MSAPARRWSTAFWLPATAGLASGPSAYAATATTGLQATATMQPICLVSATPLAFGTYAGTWADATATIGVQCTNTTPYVVAVDGGLHPSGGDQRNMMGPGAQIVAYQLFRDRARTSVWGSASGNDTVAGVGNSAIQAITVFGRVAEARYPVAGHYSDTVTVTVTY